MANTMNNYIICSTPRSGSNLLCEILSSLGFAGKPAEHLWDPPNTPREPLVDRWPRVRRDGTGDNGVFGTKPMWYQAERLERELPDLLGMRDEPLTHVLDATLAGPKYIYLTRRDRLRQAISLVRAAQTGQWRSMDSAAGIPQYDANALAIEIQFLEDDEGKWEDFFRRNAVSPYHVTYEDLDSAPQDTIAGLLTFLGHNDPTSISLRSARHRRQADEVTEDWVHRYEREGARQGFPHG